VARERYRIADLVVDVGAMSVERDGEALALAPLSFDLMVALVRAAPDVVSPDRLVDAVWGDVAQTDETLTQRVALLRRALGDDARDPRYVRSVRGRGYQLVPAVEADRMAPRGHHGRRRLVAGGLAAAAALAVAVLVVGRGRSGSAEPGPAVPGPEAVGVDELVARAGEYLRRQQEEDNELAIQLYRQALERRPAAAALVGLSLGLSQRVTKFNWPPAESDEALALADRVLAVDPDSAPAHHARALALDARGRVGAALEEYRLAWRLDPESLAPLASAANLLQVQGRLVEALEADATALVGAAPSEYLEVQIGTVLATLGFRAAAHAWLERAVELRPDNVFATAVLARRRLASGRLSEAETLARAALARGVRRPELLLVLGDAALLRGQLAECRKLYGEAVAVNPHRGHAANRLLAFEARFAPTGSDRTRLEAEYRSRVGDLEAARAAGDEWPAVALDRMVLHAAFGAPRAALEALDEAIELGHREVDWLLLDPLAEGLRAAPGFAARLERIRLLVDGERQRVAAAPWASPLLSASAGST
jgi:DNA-binding winged helix-turn-helix (wHTH) protein/tetratricopeptide (TPR) repeat protein